VQSRAVTWGRNRALVVGLLIILMFAGIFAAMWASNSWVNIRVGTAMLIVDASAGTISGPVLGAAAGFYLDGFKRMLGLQYPIYIYYQIDSVGMWSEWKLEGTVWVESARGDYPAVKTLSRDGLEIEVDLLVRWSLNPASLKELFKRYPNLNWKDVTINSIIREEVRDTISRFNAIQVIEERATIADELGQAIRDGLLAEPTLEDVIVTSNLVVDLRDIDPSIEFVKAIEAKLAAEQAKIQAEFEYERALTLARAEAQSKIIVANGTREAIDIITSITGETNTTRIAELYLTLEAFKVIAPNTKSFIVIYGTGGIPLVYAIPTNSTQP